MAFKKVSSTKNPPVNFKKAVNPPPPEGTVRPTPPPRVVVEKGVVRTAVQPQQL
jgi:hypothetical protein